MKRLWPCLVIALLLTMSASATVCDRALGAKNFAEAFPESVHMEGTVQERIQSFADAHADRVKIVDDVIMHFEDEAGSGQHVRKVMVISTDGLDDAQKTQFLNDYVDAVSWKTMSFPLSSGGGHLYTRLGNKTLDFLFSGLTSSDYRAPSSSRLETFVSLSDTEFENMRTYVQNARDSYKRVLGTFSYDGVSVSKGTLKNNKPVDGPGHNCTSWLALAPIGEHGETTKAMLGVYWDVHRNPGWWTAYLQTKLPDERIPFVVYMDSRPLTSLLERVKSGQNFDWDYNLH